MLTSWRLRRSQIPSRALLDSQEPAGGADELEASQEPDAFKSIYDTQEPAGGADELEASQESDVFKSFTPLRRSLLLVKSCGLRRTHVVAFQSQTLCRRHRMLLKSRGLLRRAIYSIGVTQKRSDAF